MSRILPCLLLLSLGAARAAEPVLPWQPTWKDAQAAAKNGKVDVFILYSGAPEWSPRSLPFKRDVVETAELKAALASRYVFFEAVRVDVRTPADREREKRQQGVPGGTRNYPAVVLADATGKVYGQLDDDPALTAAGLAKAVLDFGEQRRKRDELWAKAAEVKGVDRARLLGQGMDAVDERFAWGYSDIKAEIHKADPDDTAGYHGRYTFGQNGFYEGQVLPKLNAKQYEEAIAVCDKQLANTCYTVAQQQQILGLKFQCYLRWDKPDEGAKVLDALIAKDARSDMAEGARGYQRYLFGPFDLGAKWSHDQLRSRPVVWNLDLADTTGPGWYDVTFTATGGKDSLTISRVGVFAGDRELGGDARVQVIGAQAKTAVFRVALPQVDPTTKVTVRAMVSCAPGTDSAGTVGIRRAG